MKKEIWFLWHIKYLTKCAMSQVMCMDITKVIGRFLHHLYNLTNEFRYHYHHQLVSTNLVNFQASLISYVIDSMFYFNYNNIVI